MVVVLDGVAVISMNVLEPVPFVLAILVIQKVAHGKTAQ
jgi:hypothetical protein